MRKKLLAKIISGIVALLAGVKIMLDFLGTANFIIEKIHDPGWLGVAYNHIISFSPAANLGIFLISLIIFGYLVVGSNKRKTYIPLKKGEATTFDKQRKKEVTVAWSNLKDADREVIRAIAFKGSLREKQIIDLLRAKGFLAYSGAYTSIADRLVFVKRDFIGNHSIVPEFRPFIEELISDELSNKDVLVDAREVYGQSPDWATQAPTLEFHDDFHKRVEVFKNNRFIGRKTVYWIKVQRQEKTPKTALACKVMGIEIVASSPGEADLPYPQNGDIILHSEAPGMFQGIELSEKHPQQIYHVVSRLDGSENLQIEGFSQNDATVEFPCGGNKFRFKIGVEWSGRTYPIKLFSVWVTHEGMLKMELERDL